MAKECRDCGWRIDGRSPAERTPTLGQIDDGVTFARTGVNAPQEMDMLSNRRIRTVCRPTSTVSRGPPQMPNHRQLRYGRSYCLEGWRIRGHRSAAGFTKTRRSRAIPSQLQSVSRMTFRDRVKST